MAALRVSRSPEITNMPTQPPPPTPPPLWFLAGNNPSSNRAISHSALLLPQQRRQQRPRRARSMFSRLVKLCAGSQEASPLAAAAPTDGLFKAQQTDEMLTDLQSRDLNNLKMTRLDNISKEVSTPATAAAVTPPLESTTPHHNSSPSSVVAFPSSSPLTDQMGAVSPPSPSPSTDTINRSPPPPPCELNCSPTTSTATITNMVEVVTPTINTTPTDTPMCVQPSTTNKTNKVPCHWSSEPSPASHQKDSHFLLYPLCEDVNACGRGGGRGVVDMMKLPLGVDGTHDISSSFSFSTKEEVVHTPGLATSATCLPSTPPNHHQATTAYALAATTPTGIESVEEDSPAIISFSPTTAVEQQPTNPRSSSVDIVNTDSDSSPLVSTAAMTHPTAGGGASPVALPPTPPPSPLTSACYDCVDQPLVATDNNLTTTTDKQPTTEQHQSATSSKTVSRIPRLQRAVSVASEIYLDSSLSSSQQSAWTNCGEQQVSSLSCVAQPAVMIDSSDHNVTTTTTTVTVSRTVRASSPHRQSSPHPNSRQHRRRRNSPSRLQRMPPLQQQGCPLPAPPPLLPAAVTIGSSSAVMFHQHRQSPFMRPSPSPLLVPVDLFQPVRALPASPQLTCSQLSSSPNHTPARRTPGSPSTRPGSPSRRPGSPSRRPGSPSRRPGSPQGRRDSGIPQVAWRAKEAAAPSCVRAAGQL
eukprot:GHVS01026197.1.p1 GENE.GHVS01026197.1~~GHVS01026197.1.p1  ORF type:complete len:697 (+),score=184.05 GHVS01026197.1:206-2296(+)